MKQILVLFCNLTEHKELSYGKGVNVIIITIKTINNNEIKIVVSFKTQRIERIFFKNSLRHSYNEDFLISDKIICEKIFKKLFAFNEVSEFIEYFCLTSK